MKLSSIEKVFTLEIELRKIRSMVSSIKNSNVISIIPRFDYTVGGSPTPAAAPRAVAPSAPKRPGLLSLHAGSISSNEVSHPSVIAELKDALRESEKIIIGELAALGVEVDV